MEKVVKIKNRSGRIVDVPESFLSRVEEEGWEIIEEKTEEKVEEKKVGEKLETISNFICEKCNAKFNTAKQLHAHNLGKHSGHSRKKKK